MYKKLFSQIPFYFPIKAITQLYNDRSNFSRVAQREDFQLTATVAEGINPRS